MVEEVEELGAELEAGARGELGGLEEGEVPVGVAGAGEAVAAGVADGAGLGAEKAFGLKYSATRWAVLPPG